MGITPKQEMILVIDDDPGMSTIIEGLTGLNRSQVIRAATLVEGIELAAASRFDVVLLDHSLPDGEGLDHIHTLLLQDRLRPVLYITAQSGSQTAIQAIKRGAYEYLSKPLDFNLLRKRIAEAIEYRQLTRLPVMIEKESSAGIDSDVLVGRCRAMQDVYKAIGRLAPLATPALIEGEAGTGKEMIARAIHQHGNFQDTPFQIISSDEFNSRLAQTEKSTNPPDSIWAGLESEFNGTFLVEEIGELTQNVQQRVLRWLQTPRSIEAELTKCRLIFSSTIPCRELIETNRLRGDLFYFLSPYIIRVPALRDRPEDFDLLIAHFMQRLARISSADGRSSPPRVSPTALQLLKSYDWPGNVAQLKSVLQSVLMESRGAVLATDTLSRALATQSDHILNNQAAENRPWQPKPILVQPIADDSSELNDLHNLTDSQSWNIADFVKEQTSIDTTELYELAVKKLDSLLICQLLKLTQGNQAHAARILGITRTSLRKKIQACQIDPFRFITSRQNEKAEAEESSEGM